MRFLKVFLGTVCAMSFVIDVSVARSVLNVTEGSSRSLASSFSKNSKKRDRPYESLIKKFAVKYNVPVNLAHAVISIESNYRVYIKGAAGEIGLMQIRPSTARTLGFSGSVKELYDPATNLEYGIRYLAKAYKLSGGSTCGTVLKYNAGHAAKKMNSTSAQYCLKVKNYLASLK
ncbi:lytic transglycosylase domain-containing protein [Bartonella sp. CB178]|uniref:lytic transglycosylase domain-containing protein n=1 Tax=Bartonella sp. CB178 TaxID=3112255 RepID=UPI00300E5120